MHDQNSKSASGFTTFLKSPDKTLFWISGKAGSGKSTLVKFLVTSPRAELVIQTAIPDALVLSHFIWAAGVDPMQRQIKGILCNLLYQCLQNNQALSNAILQAFPAAKTKESYADWPNKHLELALRFAIESSTPGVCIFLDGLDEIDPGPTDGQFELVELVELVRRLCGFVGYRGKVCVSSRPEVVLRGHLAGYSTLRVQDLTALAIRKYVTDKLQQYIPPAAGDTFGRGKIIDSLCSKAEGVFLWASLAVKSIGTGILGGDSRTDLAARLDALPGNLQQLYREMWMRLNEDEVIYRKDAAFFLNSLLDSSSDIYDVGLNSPTLVAATSALTVLQVTIAFDTKLADSILGDSISISPESVAKRCREMAIRLETRCAGLVEVSPGTGALSFIHRSAKQFSCGHTRPARNTTRGQKEPTRSRIQLGQVRTGSTPATTFTNTQARLGRAMGAPT